MNKDFKWVTKRRKAKTPLPKGQEWYVVTRTRKPTISKRIKDAFKTTLYCMGIIKKYV